MAEWGRTGTDERTRIDHLIHGGGLNGAIVLSSAVPSPARDTLFAAPIELVKPVLLSPQGELPAGTLIPVFRWDPVPGASYYRIVVDDLTTGNHGVLQASVTSTTWTATAALQQGQRYSWSVEGFDDTGNGSIAVPGMAFTLAPLGVPILVSPDGPLPGAMTIPTFRWTAVPGADHYEVQVDNSSTQRAALTNTDAAQTAWMPVSPLLRGTYRWRVRAIAPNGAAAAWSGYLVFRIP